MSDNRRRSTVLILLAIASLAASIFYLLFSAAEPRGPEFLFGAWRFRNIVLAGGLFFVAAAFLAAWIGRGTAIVFWASVLPTLLFLVFLEGIGRIGLVDWSALLESEHAASGGPGWALEPSILVAGETYQDMATRFGLAHEPIPFEFKTDRFGFRNDDNSQADIIVLGDSIVLGAQVAKDSTVDSIVEGALNVPVMQAALLGISIQRQHQMLLDTELSMDGKLVVQFFFEGNDLSDSFWHRNPVSYQPETNRRRSLMKLLWPSLVRISNPPGVYSACNIGDQEYYFNWTRSSFDGLLDEFGPISDSILAFKQRVEDGGGEYALVFVPTKYRILHNQCDFPKRSLIGDPSKQLSDLPEIVRDWATRSGIDFLDLTGTLQSSAAQGISPWFWGDTHWNADGHAIAGEALANWIEDKLVNGD